MPTYTFREKDTGEEFTEICSLSEREEKLKDPNIEQVPCAAGLVRGIQIGKSMKPDNGFTDILKNIKKRSGRNNSINTFGR